MPKFTDIKEIAHGIASGDLLAMGYVHSGFDRLFEELSDTNCEHNIDVFIPCLFRYKEDDIFHLDRIADRFGGKFLITQIAPQYAHLVKNGKVDILPLPLSQVPRYLKKQNRRRKVWAFCEIGPPDKKGVCNTGYSAPFPLSFLENCEVIGLVNEKMPITYGDTLIPAHYCKFFVRIPDKLPFFPEPEVSDITQAIGMNVAQLIDDDSTIEAGIGEIMASVLGALTEKKRLRYQSGCLSEDVRALIDKGVITGKSVGNITGARTADFYEWLHCNPSIEIRTMEFTHNVLRMAAQPGFTALGSALAVDLLGQVASETIGSMQITGIGGALDFARASGIGGGNSIIAMSSTYGKNNASKIVPCFDKGDVVSLTRYDVDYVVTEYGIADLKYRSRRERALNLIHVAHPNNRELLSEKAKYLGLL